MDLSLVLYWKDSSPYELGLYDERCEGTEGRWEDVEEITLQLAGATVPACTGYETVHAPETGQVRGLTAEVPTSDGDGFVVLNALYPEQEQQVGEDLMSALVTLDVR
jgi:hypothetical protein